MNPDDVYVCDVTALIDIYQHFPIEFKRIRNFIKDGYLKIPEGISREIKRKTDKLCNHVTQWEKKYSFVVTIDKDKRLVKELTRIEQTYGQSIKVGDIVYGGFWKSPAGRKAADGQVVTVGKVLGHIVVSDDRAVRHACMLENVQCIGWTEFARRIREV